MSKPGPAPRVGKARPPLRLLLFSPFLADAERNKLIADMLVQAAPEEPAPEETPPPAEDAPAPRPKRRRAPVKHSASCPNGLRVLFG